MYSELAGKKELLNYQAFISEHSKQLKGIEELLDETLGDAWDFTLDPIALQVGVVCSKLVHVGVGEILIFVVFCRILILSTPLSWNSSRPTTR